MKILIISSLIAMCLPGHELYAGAQGGGMGNQGTTGAGPGGAMGQGPTGAQGPPSTIPIDGGIIFLLSAGLIYGAKRVWDLQRA